MSTKEEAQAKALAALKECAHGCCGETCPHGRRWKEVLRREGLLDWNGKQL